jgi:hypothetical protein
VFFVYQGPQDAVCGTEPRRRVVSVCLDLRISYDQVKEDEMGRECSTHGREACICGVKPQGKRSLGRHRRRREYNIKMTLREREWGCEDVD